MDYIGIIVLVVLLVAAVIGFFVGIGKGFLKMSSWSNEFVIATLGAILIGSLLGEEMQGTWLASVIILGAAVVLILVFMLISASFRKGFAKGIASHQRKLGYRMSYAFDENEQSIMDALDRNDTRAYKQATKESRKKFKKGRGGWGAWDRIFGAITGAVKYFVVMALIITSVLVVLDLANITIDDTAINTEYLYAIFENDTWLAVQPYIFDFFFVGIIYACIRRGYKSGVASALWTIIVIALVIGSFVGAYWLVFKTESFNGMATGLSNNAILTLIEGATEEVGEMIAKIIIMIGMAIIFLIVTILLAIFVPRGIDAARETKVFRFFDGIFGTIILTAIVVGILMFVFGMLYTLSSIDNLPPFFENLFVYFDGQVSGCFGPNNILNILDVMPINLAEYFG